MLRSKMITEFLTPPPERKIKLRINDNNTKKSPDLMALEFLDYLMLTDEVLIVVPQDDLDALARLTVNTLDYVAEKLEFQGGKLNHRPMIFHITDLQETPTSVLWSENEYFLKNSRKILTDQRGKMTHVMDPVPEHSGFLISHRGSIPAPLVEGYDRIGLGLLGVMTANMVPKYVRNDRLTDKTWSDPTTIVDLRHVKGEFEFKAGGIFVSETTAFDVPPYVSR